MQARHRDSKAAARRAMAGATFALALLSPAAHGAGCSIKTMELPVRMVGGRAVATVGMNGTPVPMVVDTGAFFSLLTEAAAAQLNLRLASMPEDMRIYGLAGKVRTHLTTVKRLQLGKGEIPDVDFVVGINEPGGDAMGLMGRNILSVADAEYDLGHGMIRLVFPSDECEHSNMAYWAGADTPVSELDLLHEIRARTPSIRADILLNGKNVTAMFDTGATTMVSLKTAHQVGLKDSDMTPRGQGTGAGAGRMDTWSAPFDQVDLGGESIRHNRLAIGDFDMSIEMLVGIDFFLSHHVYVSKQQQKMFFTYNGGPVFQLNLGDRATHDADSATADNFKADDFARRGAAAQSRGDLAGALADLDRACAMEPDNAGFLATRAEIRMAQKNPEAALSDFDAALRIDPTLDRARLERAALEGLREAQDKALDDLAELDKRLAPQSDLRRRMAETYVGLHHPTQAIAQWTLWIAAHKHDVHVDAGYQGRCWARVELNAELDKALDDCDEAVDDDGKNPASLSTRAWAYLRLGKPDKALADFNRSLAIKADGAAALYGRCLARLALGDPAAAQADLAAARKVYPDIDDSMRKAGLPLAPAPATKP